MATDRTAKPFIRFEQLTTNLANHVTYLVNGHGLRGHELLYWTKSVPKDCKTSRSVLIKTWDRINSRWKLERAKVGGAVGKNARSRATQVLIALPNKISDKKTTRIVRQLLRPIPAAHPALAVRHLESGDGIRNTHLHLVFSTRKHGYGATDDDFRLSALITMRSILHAELVRAGFSIHINDREHQVTVRPSADEMRWVVMAALKAAAPGQTARDKLRDLDFLEHVLAPQTESKRIKTWIQQEVKKAREVKGFS